MDKFRLGRTGLMVSLSGFGALPIQRISKSDAVKLVRKAYDGGINFFDTSRSYTDSEEKIGEALSDVRRNVILATKSYGRSKESMLQDFQTSLKNFKTDYVDLYQLHNPSELSDPDDPDGIFATLLDLKKKGYIRYIGMTSHKVDFANAVVDSGLYDTLMYPLNYMSTPDELALIDKCNNRDIGVIAMKPLSGGLIYNAKLTYTWFREQKNVLPVWGLSSDKELNDFLALEKNPPAMDDEILDGIRKDKEELGGSYCRSCGYCTPGCPKKIPIYLAAKMGLVLRRTPHETYVTPEWKEGMERINDCINCGQCIKKCPYDLDVPSLLKKNLIEYHDYCELHNV
ncbi:MAG: aldo/keto reductase [Clostridiales bacterium]|jgi:predicted aldo/keto reductase-like oxidoreductase|nr:aldo/keto reductase [Clostridiales bacterium]